MRAALLSSTFDPIRAVLCLWGAVILLVGMGVGAQSVAAEPVNHEQYQAVSDKTRSTQGFQYFAQLPTDVSAIFRDKGFYDRSGCSALVSRVLTETYKMPVSEGEFFTRLLLHRNHETFERLKGFSLVDIQNAIRSLGIHVTTYKSTNLLADLRDRRERVKDGPYLMVPDVDRDFRRFMLFHDADDDFVYLQDPALNRVAVSHEEFERVFMPLVMVLQGRVGDFTRL